MINNYSKNIIINIIMKAIVDLRSTPSEHSCKVPPEKDIDSE